MKTKPRHFNQYSPVLSHWIDPRLAFYPVQPCAVHWIDPHLPHFPHLTKYLPFCEPHIEILKNVILEHRNEDLLIN